MQYICGCTLNCTGDCTDGCGGLCPDPCTAFLASAGSDHTCSVTPNGGVKCWGGNINGQLGNGTSTSSSTLVPTTGLASGTYAVSAGGAFTCALLSSGGVRCWGSNFSGQLGDGTKTSRTTPVDVIGLASGAYEVAPASGGSHVCALLTNGGVQCWGSGQSTPVYITGMTSGVSAVATGSGHTCAILTAGDVKCWGVNFYGQLGDGTTTSSSTPVNVIGLASGVVAVAAGGNHTCALLTAGGVKCWGNNSGGQLGDGTTSSSPTPVSVTGLASAVIGISTGGSHTCALLNYGGVRCWGGNSSGQLGDGTTTSSAMPVDVTDLTSDVRLVSAGASHTCAVMTSGGVKCWGSNYRGQLGDGNTVDKLTPTSVLGFGQ